jgi:U3 small nucleolar RNA-associated protein 3
LLLTFLPDEIFEFSDQEVLPGSPEITESDPDDGKDEDEDEADGVAPQRAIKSNLSRKAPQDSETAEPQGDDDDGIGEWGTTKRDYYDADAIETEADALEEENEVRRLQRKQLERLTEEDFGLDELDWIDRGGDDDVGDREGSEDGVIRELLPEPEIIDSASPEERLKILRTKYPEFEPLSKEFVDLQPLLEDLTPQAETFALNGSLQTAHKAEVHAIEETPLVILKHRALSAYLGAICMYFVLLTSTHADAGSKITSMPPEKLRDHSIMDTLVQCRELWSKIKDIPIVETHDVPKKSLTSKEISTPVIELKLQGDPITSEIQKTPQVQGAKGAGSRPSTRSGSAPRTTGEQSSCFLCS